MLIKPDVNRFAKIKVLGIGGGGTNALNSMITQAQIQGVDFVAVNTDQQHLLASLAQTKVQIGDGLTKGLGAGADPELGSKAAEESLERIKETIVGADMVFLTYGAGGGTGTGAGPVIAELAKKLGILTIGVVTKPFGFEGTRRMVVADEGIEILKGKVDTLIIIPNQKLLDVVDKSMSLLEALLDLRSFVLKVTTKDLLIHSLFTTRLLQNFGSLNSLSYYQNQEKNFLNHELVIPLFRLSLIVLCLRILISY